jgi:hypothetical protein
MGVVENLKDVAELVKKAREIELYKKISAAEDEVREIAREAAARGQGRGTGARATVQGRDSPQGTLLLPEARQPNTLLSPLLGEGQARRPRDFSLRQRRAHPMGLPRVQTDVSGREVGQLAAAASDHTRMVRIPRRPLTNAGKRKYFLLSGIRGEANHLISARSVYVPINRIVLCLGAVQVFENAVLMNRRAHRSQR